MKYTIDTIRDVSIKLGEAYRGKISNIGGAVVSTAYVLSKIEKTTNISTATLDTFIETAHIPLTFQIFFHEI